jgi:hypothetical protein
VLLAKLLEELLQQLHLIKHDFADWRIALLVSQNKVLLGSLG